MSDFMHTWLKHGKCKIKAPPKMFLPDPRQIDDATTAASTSSANDAVNEKLTPTSRKRKRSEEYGNYSPEIRLKIAKHCLEHGPAKTARKFSQELSRPVNESTVRNMKKSYLSSPKRELFKTAMPRSPRGRPTKLGDELDTEVQNYIKSLRKSGGIVNSNIIIAAAQGIVQHKDKKLLVENGGHVELNKDWARSIMRRMGLAKRKGTKSVKNLPTDFDEIKTAYVDRITQVVKEHGIPDTLVINWDQTGVNLVPCSNWTMDVKGSKQVPVIGIDDKRQVTALLAITKSGRVLPPQIIYAGKTDKCHPDFDFPNGWDIDHTPTHWSTAESMERYVEKVIVPYVDSVREEFDLPLRQKALCIFDIYQAHRGEDLLNLLGKNGIRVVFVPAACTDKLQPLDLIPNNIFKTHLKSEFSKYYADRVKKELASGTNITEISSKICLKTSTIKPLHARWLVNAIEKLSCQEDIIKDSFKQAGI